MNKFLIAVTAMMSVILGIAVIRLVAIEGEMRSLSDQVVLQTGAINHGLKNLVPLVLPQEIEDEITKIEVQLKNETTWPRTPPEIQQVTDRLASVVNKLPPWAQEDLLPRLVPRRWDAEALWILEVDPKSDMENLTEHLSKIHSHLAIKPIDSSDEIEKLLEQKIQKINIEIPKVEQDVAILAARKALETKQEMESALRGIVVYDNAEAKSLAKELKDFIIDRSFNQEMGILEKDLDQYEKLVDVSMREYAIFRSSQAIMDLRFRVNSSGINNGQLDVKITALDKKVLKHINDANIAKQLRDAEKIKQYQVWVLTEIKKIRTFKIIEDIEIGKITGILDRSNPASEARKKANGISRRILIDELIAHMAPINQALLEPAVSQWFGKVYQKQYSELSNETDQLEVIQKFATVHKKMIGEMQ
jgi:hypothetical protein